MSKKEVMKINEEFMYMFDDFNRETYTTKEIEKKEKIKKIKNIKGGKINTDKNFNITIELNEIDELKRILDRIDKFKEINKE